MFGICCTKYHLVLEDVPADILTSSWSLWQEMVMTLVLSTFAASLEGTTSDIIKGPTLIKPYKQTLEPVKYQQCQVSGEPYLPNPTQAVSSFL